VKVGDLISFKPKSFGDDDWSNAGIVLESYEHDLPTDDADWKDLIWVVWVDGGKYMVNERNDDVMYLTSS
tara:strand:- start:55 stop:264 length:210 start_codon:yes stop_codon:yes gene_type:complete